MSIETQQNGMEERVPSLAAGSEGTLSPKVDYSAPGLDTYHWSDVGKSFRDQDARSVNSSVAAERDAQSIYDVIDAVDDSVMDNDGSEEPVSRTRSRSMAGSLPRGEAPTPASLAQLPSNGSNSPGASAGARDTGDVPNPPESGQPLPSPPESVRSAAIAEPGRTTAAGAGDSDTALQELTDVLPAQQLSSLASVGAEAGASWASSSVGGSDSAVSVAGTPHDLEGNVVVGLVDERSRRGSEQREEYAGERKEAAEMENRKDEHHGELENKRDGQMPESDPPLSPSPQHLSPATLVSPPTNASTPEAAPAPSPEPLAAQAASARASAAFGAGAEADDADDLAVYAARPEGAVEAGPSSAPPASRAEEAARQVAALQTETPAPAPVEFSAPWEERFKGLLHCDGRDSKGRVVVVIDADVVPPNMKASAARYVTAHLEPLVAEGEYVLVLTSRSAKLPSMWIMGAYTTLPRPFKKNVKWILLVRPSGFLKAVLALLRPLLSAKAGRKIRQVAHVREIESATDGEVALAHLGQSFLGSPAGAAELTQPLAGEEAGDAECAASAQP